MNRVSIPWSMLEDSRDVNSGIAVDTLQKSSFCALHIAHPNTFKFWIPFRQANLGANGTNEIYKICFI